MGLIFELNLICLKQVVRVLSNTLEENILRHSQPNRSKDVKSCSV